VFETVLQTLLQWQTLVWYEASRFHNKMAGRVLACKADIGTESTYAAKGQRTGSRIVAQRTAGMHFRDPAKFSSKPNVLRCNGLFKTQNWCMRQGSHNFARWMTTPSCIRPESSKRSSSRSLLSVGGCETLNLPKSVTSFQIYLATKDQGSVGEFSRRFETGRPALVNTKLF
jgi:hypothetical protein